jgi:hypothetical protein
MCIERYVSILILVVCLSCYPAQFPTHATSMLKYHQYLETLLYHYSTFMKSVNVNN